MPERPQWRDCSRDSSSARRTSRPTACRSGSSPAGCAPTKSRAEALRQLRQRAVHTARLAGSYREAGFTPVIDDVIVGRDRLALYQRELRARPLRLVVLAPPLEVTLQRDEQRGNKRVGRRWAHLDAEQRSGLDGIGLWLDTAGMTPERTVAAILARYPA